MKTFNIEVRYSGDSSIAGSLEAEKYSKEVKWELLEFTSNLFNKPGFAWIITDGDGVVWDSFNF